jgi:hypothetical protein
MLVTFGVLPLSLQEPVYKNQVLFQSQLKAWDYSSHEKACNFYLEHYEKSQ